MALEKLNLSQLSGLGLSIDNEITGCKVIGARPTTSQNTFQVEILKNEKSTKFFVGAKTIEEGLLAKDTQTGETVINEGFNLTTINGKLWARNKSRANQDIKVLE